MPDSRPVQSHTGESLLFLTDEQLRQGIEAMFFAYRGFTADPDRILAEIAYGRAHHRAVHFIGRAPGTTVNNLLAILGLTALITPLERDGVSLDVMYMMIGFTALLIPFMWSGLRVGRREGAVLLACYGGYVLWLANGAPSA